MLCETYAGGNVILSDQLSQLLSAEMAPFLAEASEQLEKATEGLQPHEAIQHLETTLAEAEAEATRLGLNLPSAPAAMPPPPEVQGESASIVVIQQTLDS